MYVPKSSAEKRCEKSIPLKVRRSPRRLKLPLERVHVSVPVSDDMGNETRNGEIYRTGGSEAQHPWPNQSTALDDARPD